MRSRRAVRLRTGVLLATIVVAALGLGGSAHATPYRQTFLQFNMCGNACSNGGFGIVTELANALGARAPFAVTLNEVCENQYAQLRTDLPQYHGRFDPTGVNCRNGSRYGNAILMRTAAVALVGSWELPAPVRHEPRRLMCLRPEPESATALVVCVTHISNISANIGVQVRAVADLLARLGPGVPIVVGGDFNTEPADPRLDPLYSTCYGAGAGLFHEADATKCQSRAGYDQPTGSDVINEHTYGQRKLDYIFLSRGDWSASSADAADVVGGLSDHNGLWATTVISNWGVGSS